MQDFLLFLGRFHVLVLHVPIGVILGAVVLEWVGTREKYRRVAGAAPFLWGFAALGAVVTVALGYLRFAEGGFMGASASLHRGLGTSVAVVTAAIWWLSTRAAALYERARPGAAVIIVALVALTGHYGGNLTHGSAYLVDYAPAPLRALAGVDPRRLETESAPAAPAGVPVALDAAAMTRLSAAGFLVRPISQHDARLQVGLQSPGRDLDAEQLATLLSVAVDIVELNLQDSGIDDAELAGFERLSALTQLRLSNGRVTDRGVAMLERLQTLEHLNLYGNAGVTDGAIVSFARMPSLRELYLWETGVSAEGVAALRAQRPDLTVQMGTAAVLPPMPPADVAPARATMR